MNKLSTKEKINDVKINQQGVTNLLKVVGTSAPNLQNRVLEKVDKLTAPYLKEVDRISKKKRYSKIELIHFSESFVKNTIFTKGELEELDNLLIKITLINMFLRFDHETGYLDLGLQLGIEKTSKLNKDVEYYYDINSLPIDKISGKLSRDAKTIGTSNSYCKCNEPYTRQLYKFELFSKQRKELENRSLLYFYTDVPKDLFELIKLEETLVQKKDSGYFDKSLKLLDVSPETIKNSLRDKYPTISHRMSEYVSYGIATWGLYIIDLLINAKLINKFKNHIYELIYIIEYSICHKSSYLTEILKHLDKNIKEVYLIRSFYLENLSQIINKNNEELLFKLISLIKEEEIKQQEEENAKERLKKTVSEINLKIKNFVKEIDGLIMQQGEISNPSLLIQPSFRFDDLLEDDDYERQQLAYDIAQDLYIYFKRSNNK